jgi:hypothetical protein
MRRILILLMAVAMLIASAAQASRAPTGGDSKAIASAALHRAALRVSHNPGPYGCALAQKAAAGTLRRRNPRWLRAG